MRQQQQPRQQPAFLDRYRWWLFLGSFAINLFFYAVASAAPALEGVRLIVNVLSVIPLIMGIAGFCSRSGPEVARRGHPGTRRRRAELGQGK